MPYARNAGLPKSVRSHLPKDAQTIYRKTYNGAWEHYATVKKRRGSVTREETAHRVAWPAIKDAFQKQGDRRVKRP